MDKTTRNLIEEFKSEYKLKYGVNVIIRFISEIRYKASSKLFYEFPENEKYRLAHLQLMAFDEKDVMIILV